MINKETLKDEATKVSVSFPASVLGRAREKADAEHGGILSRYLLSLIERDLTGSTAGIDSGPNVIEELAKRWRPDIAPKISAELPAGFDQRALLGAILDDLPNFFRVTSGSFERAARENVASDGFWGEARFEYDCRLFPKSNADEVLMCYCALAAMAEEPGRKIWAEIYAAPLMSPALHRLAGIISEGKWSAPSAQSKDAPTPAPAKPKSKFAPVNSNRPTAGSTLQEESKPRKKSASA